MVLDSVEFARRSAKLSGVVELVRLTRLHDQIAEVGGKLNVRLAGEQDEERRNWLSLDIEGRVVLRCQRCLGGVEFPVTVATRLELVSAGDPWPDESLTDDETDAIAADPALSVADLVEDEVLLALPLAPMHDNCTLPEAAGGREDRSPFAALAVLKKH